MTPPAYSLHPGFNFDLSPLLKAHEAASKGSLTLSVTDPISIKLGREQLQSRSFLDPSQSTALVNCLIRSAAIIQHSGASKVSMQLLRVLLQHVKPIMIITFTNRAVDNILEAVLNAKITKNIVRLGSRVPKRLSSYALDSLELVTRSNSRLDRSKRQEAHQLKELGKQLDALIKSITNQEVADEELDRYLSMAYPQHLASLQSPPDWVWYLYNDRSQDAAVSRQRQCEANSNHLTLLGFWLSVKDLAIHGLPRNPEQETETSTAHDNQQSSGAAPLEEENFDDLDSAWMAIPSLPVAEATTSQISPEPLPGPPATLPDFFARFNMQIPPIPQTERPIDQLKEEFDIWNMSATERQQLYHFWREEAAQLFKVSRAAESEALRKRLAEVQQRHDALQDQMRLRLLQKKDIVACTTNSATKFASLIKGLALRVVLVDEPGQVLEAHLLASLVPSVEHLICINDPLEPRSTINLAPDRLEGCLYSCNARLDCSLDCAFQCPSDWTRAAVECIRDCERLRSRYLACDRWCSQQSGNCRLPVFNVKLPCDHVEKQVPCFQVVALDKVRCRVKVVKALLRCEHSAVMECSRSPENWICKEMCGQRAKCGHICKARCYDCQQRNIRSPDDTEEHGEVSERIVREHHVPHRCGRILFCQHPCSSDCGNSEDHKCTTDCQAACRQLCSHVTCNKPCGTSCNACKEECVWKCPHYTCPVPCGSPCVRLPCDKPCTQTLTCGHTCPSVCGEVCDDQVCPSCTADDDIDVVDLVMQRKLNEVNPLAGTLDEMLITLKCGHCFTVETLDGHCELGQFYTQDANGTWIAPCMPSTSGFRQPPICPTCRAPITAHRYSRVVKRADLDIAERNVADSIVNRLDALNTELMALDTEASRKALDDQSLQIQATRDKDLEISPNNIIEMRTKIKQHVDKHKDDVRPLVAAGIANMASIFQMPHQEKKVWLTVVGPFIRFYVRAVEIAATRFAHSAAWEASLAALYRAELKTVADQPHSEADALARAMQKIAQPRPRADMRYATEALWQSIELRLTIANLARHWLESVPADQPCRLAVCVAYCVFVLKTAGKDAENALASSRNAESHRQTLRSHLFTLKINFELTSINVWMRQKRPLGTAARFQLLTEVQSRVQNAEETIEGVLATYRQTRSRSDEDEQWIIDNFTSVSDKILEAWQSLEDAVRKGLNQPVSREDKIVIIRSLKLSNVGHFYLCPNGHAYVIGECGAAMVASTCPECGALIGGASHTLDPSNTVDHEMVELAREARQA
ncbi:AAA domain-containing protein [Auriculariales sp. MPI-PUGE-AT-0066]|nr:AAA domain-containing protein [Auriculariales sp. MPI-PUGE-AT-0066]